MLDLHSNATTSALKFDGLLLHIPSCLLLLQCAGSCLTSPLCVPQCGWIEGLWILWVKHTVFSHSSTLALVHWLSCHQSNRIPNEEKRVTVSRGRGDLQVVPSWFHHGDMPVEDAVVEEEVLDFEAVKGQLGQKSTSSKKNRYLYNFEFETMG